MSPGFKEIKDRLTFVLGANKCQWRFSCVIVFINDNYSFLCFDCSGYQVPWVFKVLSYFFFINRIVF